MSKKDITWVWLLCIMWLFIKYVTWFWKKVDPLPPLCNILYTLPLSALPNIKANPSFPSLSYTIHNQLYDVCRMSILYLIMWWLFIGVKVIFSSTSPWLSNIFWKEEFLQHDWIRPVSRATLLQGLVLKNHGAKKNKMDLKILKKLPYS